MQSEVKIRPVDLDYPTDDLPRHFVGGDIMMSHIVAMLSGMFPDGEKFFMRSVRRVSDQITNDELGDKVKAFLGQEAMHGREHRRFNELLADLGYPTKGLEKAVDRGLRIRQRLQSKRANLAVTAALEHYTATLAETLLSSEEARQMLADVPEVQSLFLWHALEESEHKAVAFDVYLDVGGRDRMRRFMMNVTTVIFLTALTLSTTVSVAKDPVARRNPRRLWHSIRALRRSPWLNKAVVRKIRDYNRPDFHPDDWDATELLDRWRAELFGAGGVVTPHLRRSAEVT